MPTKIWTAEACDLVRRIYADTDNDIIAAMIGSTSKSVRTMASKTLQLTKSKTYRAAQNSAAAFGKNNSGMKGKRIPNSVIPEHPIGTTLVHKGLLRKKVAMIGGRNVMWRNVSELVWIASNGPVPLGHLIIFKPGTKTTIEEEIIVENLECLSKADMLRRNSIHTLPPEIVKYARLKGSLTKAIKHVEKQNVKNDQ